MIYYACNNATKHRRACITCNKYFIAMGCSLLNLDTSITKLLLMSFLFDNFLGVSFPFPSWMKRFLNFIDIID